MSASEGDWTQTVGSAAGVLAFRTRWRYRSAHFRTQRRPTKNRHRPMERVAATIVGKLSTESRCRTKDRHYHHLDECFVTGSNAANCCGYGSLVAWAVAEVCDWDGFAGAIAGVISWQCRRQCRLETVGVVVCKMGTLQGRTDCNLVRAVLNVVVAVVAEDGGDGVVVVVAAADKNDRMMRMWANRFR